MFRKVVLVGTLMIVLGAGFPATAQTNPVGSYIVVLKDSVRDPGSVASEHSRSQGARVDHVYSSALKGYSATMSATAASKLTNDKRVSYVEADGPVTKTTVQQNPTWGLDRIDQHPLPLSLTYQYDATGAGVTAYIIDTGITSTSAQFGTRVTSGRDFVQDDNDTTDCDGHGTHVAGTVGSATYGVAKAVNLVGVRVLDCSGNGSWSDVIAGVDWATANHTTGAPAVANMSLGGGFISSVNQAVANSIADGITYAVSAGNGNQAGKAQNACNYSPASTPTALTIGATSTTDAKATWSNYGTCVDLFAPGVSITSTSMSGGTLVLSGTSMASPHVAGVAALYLQANPSASPAAVANAINSGATTGVVGSAGSGSPNRLLYSLLTPPPPPPPAAPIANNDSASTLMNNAVTTNVLANDSDANGDALTVSISGNPSNGTVAVNSSDNTVTYTPAADFVGTDSYVYTATDPGGLSDTATVTVTVAAPPEPAASATVTYALSKNGRNLSITIVLRDADGNAVPNAAVDASLTNGASTWSLTGTTSSSGSVRWELRNAPAGTYSTTINEVAGDAWAGTTNQTPFTKT